MLISGSEFLGEPVLDSLNELKNLKDELWLSLSSKSPEIEFKRLKYFFKGVIKTLDEFYDFEPNLKIKNLELENLFFFKNNDDDIIGLVDIFFFSNFEIEKWEILDAKNFDLGSSSRCDTDQSEDNFDDLICSRCQEKIVNSEKESETCSNILQVFYQAITFNKPHPNFNVFLLNTSDYDHLFDHKTLRFFNKYIKDMERGTLSLKTLLRDRYFRESSFKDSKIQIKVEDKDAKDAIIDMLEHTLDDMKNTLNIKNTLMAELLSELQEVFSLIIFLEKQKNSRIGKNCV